MSVRLLEPGVIARGVVHDEVGDHPHAELVGLIDTAMKILDCPVVGMDGKEVGDVVAAVAQRRRVHRQEPEAVDPEPLEVLELLRETAQVAQAVAVAVVEAANVDLVEDRALEPQRIGLKPVSRRRSGFGGGVLRPHFTEPASSPCTK